MFNGAQFPGGLLGMVLNLEEDNVGVALLGEDTALKAIGRRTGRIFSVPIGDAIMGRVLNPSVCRRRSRTG